MNPILLSLIALLMVPVVALVGDQIGYWVALLLHRKRLP